MPNTVRLALVVNGGISLAVWMAGVVKELDLAMRASQGRSEGTADEDMPQYEAWREHLAGTRVEIDIVAGTSAGGLNGTILATSYGLGAPLPDLKTMWRISADVSPDALLPPTTRASVLDGDFFAEKVDEVLGGIRDGRGSTEPERPVTLFVTGTTLGVHERSYQDSFGQSFRSPDHRRVYRFRSSPPSGETNEFDTSFAALAPAARASASFPVAFAPVEEPDELLARALGPHDAVDWLMDGGVLDNAPFGPVLNEIIGRPVDTDVDRIVVYVVPSDGGRGSRPAVPARPSSRGSSPTWFTVLRSALAFPGEADFRDDLEVLARIFATADARRGAAAQALRSAVSSTATADVRAALRAGSGFLRTQYAKEQSRYDEAAFVERIQGRTTQAVTLAPVLGLSSGTGSTVPQDLGAFGHSAAERMVRNLLADLRQGLREQGGVSALRTGAVGVSVALATLVRLREGIEDTVVAEAASGGSTIRDLVAGALDMASGARRAALDAAVNAYASAMGADRNLVADSVMAVEIVTQALAPEVRPAPPPFRLLRLGPDNDSPLAPSAGSIGDRKLYGTRLGHFGAFGREEWRDWDWGWGRLDAAAQLARAMGMDPERVRDLQQGIWAAEGAGRDLELATLAVGDLTDADLRPTFGLETVNALLDSAARMLSTKAPDQPSFVQTLAPKAAAILRTRWSFHPLWVLPGALVRRKLRSYFR